MLIRKRIALIYAVILLNDFINVKRKKYYVNEMEREREKLNVVTKNYSLCDNYNNNNLEMKQEEEKKNFTYLFVSLYPHYMYVWSHVNYYNY